MRTVEEIQNFVYAAFEDMLRRPEMYQPCSPNEFEARLSSYLWVLCVSEELEQAWAHELNLIREDRGWSESLDVASSIQAEAKDLEPTQLIQQVVQFYESLATRLGFDPREQ
ncbi:MAG: hypothetical protein P8J27_10440 [Mariniblastus sp.]|nr:hypothetical protein [Mariniblastus sp.]